MPRQCQLEKLVHHSQHKLHSISHAQLAMKALDMGVNRVRGNVEVRANGEFGSVRKNAPDNFQFTPRETEAFGDGIPGDFRKHF